METGGEIHVERLPVIEADPTRMRQLYQNLIGNALTWSSRHHLEACEYEDAI